MNSQLNGYRTIPLEEWLTENPNFKDLMETVTKERSETQQRPENGAQADDHTIVSPQTVIQPDIASPNYLPRTPIMSRAKLRGKVPNGYVSTNSVLADYFHDISGIALQEINEILKRNYSGELTLERIGYEGRYIILEVDKPKLEGIIMSDPEIKELARKK